MLSCWSPAAHSAQGPALAAPGPSRQRMGLGFWKGRPQGDCRLWCLRSVAPSLPQGPAHWNLFHGVMTADADSQGRLLAPRGTVLENDRSQTGHREPFLRRGLSAEETHRTREVEAGSFNLLTDETTDTSASQHPDDA